MKPICDRKASRGVEGLGSGDWHEKKNPFLLSFWPLKKDDDDEEETIYYYY